MAVTADIELWAFIWWLKHNPFKSIEAMNEDDLDAMVTAFVTENATAGPFTTTDHGTYTGVTFPKTDTAAGSGVTAAQTVAACDQSHYPEQHKSGG